MTDVAAHHLIAEIQDHRLHGVGEPSRRAVRVLVFHRAPDRQENRQTDQRSEEEEYNMLRRGQIERQRTDVDRIEVRQVDDRSDTEHLEFQFGAVQQVMHEHSLQIRTAVRRAVFLSGLSRTLQHGQKPHLCFHCFARTDSKIYRLEKK